MTPVSRAALFAAVYAALWAAHDVGDHVVQTDHQAAGKAKDWRCMAGHVATYTATQAVAVAALRTVGARPRLGRVVAGLAWSAATHAFLDRRWPVVEVLERTGSDRFAAPMVWTRPLPHADAASDEPQQWAHLPLHGPYLADQALHHACVLVAALIIAGRR